MGRLSWEGEGAVRCCAVLSYFTSVAPQLACSSTLPAPTLLQLVRRRTTMRLRPLLRPAVLESVAPALAPVAPLGTPQGIVR